MKAIIIIVIASFIGCSDAGAPGTDDIVNYTGTIVQKSSEFYVIQSDTQFYRGRAFYPSNLSRSFKREGLRVLFSGSFEADPTAEYLYPPLRLSRIQTIN